MNVEVAKPDPSTSCLNPNWVEELLRRDNKRVTDVWCTTFAKDFKSFLEDQPENDPEARTFLKYITQELALTDLSFIYLDLRRFRSYMDGLRARRWIQHHGASGGTGSMPTLPAPTSFNCAARFLEFYFFR